MKETQATSAKRKGEDIAIIGLSGRYPKSDNHYQFWDKLEKGENFVTEVPADRWAHSKYYKEDLKGFLPNKTRCKYGSFINSYDYFDASFFDIREEDVMFMSAQERLAMQTTWSCLEDAGYTPKQLAEHTGVFTGVTNNEYQKLVPVPTYLFSLNARIAYFFNFQGPTVTTDAGCASSLGAIEMAAQSLNDGRCKTAVVVGANLLQHPDHFVGASPMMSPTKEPKARPFGKDDGWVPAEGVVSMLLKPLAQAVADGDHIYTVIKSTHVIQSGKTAWFMAFDPKKQAKLIEENFQKSGIHPETISYIEAASNGSLLGDTIEMEGLTAAFKKYTARKQFCPIGTVKSNIGHSEGVSTLEQLTKVILQFKKGVLLPLIPIEDQNSNLRMDKSPFYLLREKKKWERSILQVKDKKYVIPRRAAVSSFCMGGNMGHLILEEYQDKRPDAEHLNQYFIPFSAKTEGQLKALLSEYLHFFKVYKDYHTSSHLLDVMFTQCLGRVDFNHKLVFLAGSWQELLALMEVYLNGGEDECIITGVSTEQAVEAAMPTSVNISESLWPQLAHEWISGKVIEWRSYFQNKGAKRVALPTIVFDAKHFPLPSPQILDEHKYEPAE